MPENERDTGQKGYDAIYSAETNVFGEGQPEPIVVAGAALLPEGAEVLEYGAGEGRNGLYLARQGFQVRATDRSAAAVENMTAVAQANHLDNFAAQALDARAELGPSQAYDMIISTFMLHHLTAAEGHEFLRKIQQQTKPGGVNVITAMTKDGAFYKKDPATPFCYLGLGELKQLYAGWKIIRSYEQEGEARQTKADGTPMRNVASFLIAQKV